MVRLHVFHLVHLIRRLFVRMRSRILSASMFIALDRHNVLPQCLDCFYRSVSTETDCFDSIFFDFLQLTHLAYLYYVSLTGFLRNRGTVEDVRVGSQHHLV